MKKLTQFWVFLTSLFLPVHPHKQAMLNVLNYIKDNPHMWEQRGLPNPDTSKPTCFGGLLLREMGIDSFTFDALPAELYEYLSDNCAFSWDKTLPKLEQIVNDYK